jgi:hypothetical protein
MKKSVPKKEEIPKEEEERIIYLTGYEQGFMSALKLSLALTYSLKLDVVKNGLTREEILQKINKLICKLGE